MHGKLRVGKRLRLPGNHAHIVQCQFLREGSEGEAQAEVLLCASAAFAPRVAAQRPVRAVSVWTGKRSMATHWPRKPTRCLPLQIASLLYQGCSAVVLQQHRQVNWRHERQQSSAKLTQLHVVSAYLEDGHLADYGPARRSPVDTSQQLCWTRRCQRPKRTYRHSPRVES